MPVCALYKVKVKALEDTFSEYSTTSPIIVKHQSHVCTPSFPAPQFLHHPSDFKAKVPNAASEKMGHIILKKLMSTSQQNQSLNSKEPL